MKQPILQRDYSFFTDPETKDQVRLLNARDVLYGLTLSCVVPCKVGHSVYAQAELRRFALETSRAFGTLQADPEPALLTVVQAVTSELGGLAFCESPTEWKQAQGSRSCWKCPAASARSGPCTSTRHLHQDMASSRFATFWQRLGIQKVVVRTLTSSLGPAET